VTQNFLDFWTKSMKICGSEEEKFREILLPIILWWRLMERLDTTLTPKAVLLFGT
jgi:hypothetical protein